MSKKESPQRDQHHVDRVLAGCGLLLLAATIIGMALFVLWLLIVG